MIIKLLFLTVHQPPATPIANTRTQSPEDIYFGKVYAVEENHTYDLQVDERYTTKQ